MGHVVKWAPAPLSPIHDTTPPAIREYPVLLCPSYDSEKAPFSSQELRKAPSLLRGLNLALLCVILFFSSPSCLYSPTWTQVSVRTPLGLPTPQAGSGMEKRGPVHVSVDV